MSENKTLSNGQAVPESRLSIIQSVTTETLDTMTEQDLADPGLVESVVIDRVNLRFAAERPMRKLANLTELLPFQIAEIMMRTYRIVRVAAAGKNADEDQDMLAIYQISGSDMGTYVGSNLMFRKIIRDYDKAITTRSVTEVLAALAEMAPRVTVTSDRNLVAVNNGIFDYDTKQLMPFSQDYVFLTKSKVNYNPNAMNPVIHNDDDNTDWDVESWMKELSDNQEIVDLLWQILGAIIRPNVPWNKSAWFYSELGNNGKGTLCELMRQLCGEGSYASIPLSAFSQEFMLEPLLRASAIIVDENDVGVYIDKAANLKAVITGDTLSINRKFKTPVAFDFHGFMVQCLNELPRIKDKSDSFFRRQLFIPFEKCFTGHERKYIKHDYLHRTDVLEYVLWRVLNMDYYTLSEPDVCKNALDEYKDYNDPIRQFLAEVMPAAVWDMLPYEFMYALYKKWYERNGGSDRMKSRSAFIKEIKQLVHAEYMDWEICDTGVCPGNRMSRPEFLVKDYDLKEWMDPSQKGDMVYRPILKTTYKGFRRIVPRNP